jgi:hypothetical protein
MDAASLFMSSLVPRTATVSHTAPVPGTEWDHNRLVHHEPLPPLHSLLDVTLTPQRIALPAPTAIAVNAAAAAAATDPVGTIRSLESDLNENDMRRLNFDGAWTSASH